MAIRSGEQCSSDEKMICDFSEVK